MTREERLDWLCRLRSGLVWFDVPLKERPMFENALSEEIEALSAEPCDDAISRQAVFEQINSWIGSGEYRYTNATDYLTKRISKLPPVTPKQKMGRWIPVSERLPKDFQRVLVTIVNYNEDRIVRVAEYHHWKCEFQILENHERWEVGEKGLLAWMPLPEPYMSENPTGSESEDAE